MAAPTKEAAFELELELRAKALDASKRAIEDRRAAIAVLADFYEQHGQPSRATLWRAQLASAKDPEPRYVPHDVPDLQTRERRFQDPDPRRNQMIWLLRKLDLSVRTVAAAFDLSATRIAQIVGHEDRRIRMHAKKEQLRPTLKATERLVVAGALPGDRPARSDRETWFDLCEEPPEDWPAEHKRPK